METKEYQRAIAAPASRTIHVMMKTIALPVVMFAEACKL